MPEPKKYLSNFTMPDGKVLWVKDVEARQAISGGIKFIGVTTTPIQDGASTYPVIINGEEIYPQNGNLVVYNRGEFVWMDYSSTWHEFGTSADLGSLAYKDSASGTYAPAGTVSKPNVTVTQIPVHIKEIDVEGRVNPGSRAFCTFPNLGVNYDPVKSELALTWSEGSFTPNTPTYVTLPTSKQTMVLTSVSAELETAPAFTGTESTITVE